MKKYLIISFTLLFISLLLSVLVYYVVATELGAQPTTEPIPARTTTSVNNL